ncbi:hypothetical protein TNCV_4587731 [Trichonephila clavipes]|uniref:Uncharacterized protein n=1 Tax=Trichonephila clavipes TaxID=2585209 RepID=A0A8X6V3D7_TRICX|nr:hypothetical protein TNCV_4587731 [Trichonephila clavipes]
MTTTYYRSRSAEGVRHFFRRGTTLLSDRVFARGTMSTLCYRRLSPFFRPGTTQLPVASWFGTMITTSFGCSSRRGTTLLSGRVLVHAER